MFRRDLFLRGLPGHPDGRPPADPGHKEGLRCSHFLPTLTSASPPTPVSVDLSQTQAVLSHAVSRAFRLFQSLSRSYRLNLHC